MNKIIAIFASARRHGNTGKLIDWVAGELNIDVIDLAEKNISAYDYGHKNIDDDFIILMNSLLKYEKIIFVTPVYWYAASAQMKIFIDRTSDFLDIDELKDIGRRLRNKTAYIVCTSISNEADQAFLNSFKSTFEYLGMKYGGHLHANCEKGYNPQKYKNSIDKFVQMIRSSDS